MLEKTFRLLANWKVGDPAPDVTYDEQELQELGNCLRRLVYSPRALRKRLQQSGVSVIPANFYSEIPTIEDIERTEAAPVRYDAVFNRQHMMDTLGLLARYAHEFAPPLEKSGSTEFAWKGGPFSFSDAMAYYCFVRHHRPKTIIEIGSGWSTLVAHEAVKKNGAGSIVCIEPYPPDFLDRIGSVSEIVRERAQDIDPSFFNSRLSDGDILFIDSTHTVKHGSDCLHIYLQVLPKLTVDVTIHAHDIYLPLPQPAQNMLDRQIYWTEQYLLYAYLIGNDRTGVDYGSTWHMQENADALRSFMCGRYPPGGASLWFCQKSRSGVR